MEFTSICKALAAHRNGTLLQTEQYDALKVSPILFLTYEHGTKIARVLSNESIIDLGYMSYEAFAKLCQRNTSIIRYVDELTLN